MPESEIVGELVDAPQPPRARRTRRPKAEPATNPIPGRVADAALIAALLGLTFLLGAFPLKDTDFWWHLKAGDEIRRTGTVPTVDTYTFGAEGHRWTDLHWIFQVLLSHGYERTGIAGLNLAKCGITALAVGLFLGARRKGWPVWAMVLAWIPALLVLAGRMYVRPETLTLLYLAVYLAILFRIDDRPRLALLLPLVQVAWVNTQGLFVLGPIVLGMAILAAACRRGAFDRSRTRWWRTILVATALVGLACLINPYGLVGALFPFQLAATMRNEDFAKSIAELMPLPTLIEKTGFSNGPLQIHLATIVLGLLSFLIPFVWRVADRVRQPAPAVEVTRSRKRVATPRPGVLDGEAAYWPSFFRLLLFSAFTALSWKATRNSHQFAAVAGTITAWNFGEWGLDLAKRRAARGRGSLAAVGRSVAFVAVGILMVAVGSGALYRWEAEGRTVGIGEEPHWFPRDAVAFAGRADMPSRSLCFHNGHAAYYEYAWAPGRKTFADARLEVVGEKVYAEYLAIEKRIAENAPGWEAELDAMGRPIVLVDNIHAGFAKLAASLLASRHYRCVWFDEVACLFVHDTYTGAVASHAIDFAALHFNREPRRPAKDGRAEAMMAKTCWNILFKLRGLAPDGVDRNSPRWTSLRGPVAWNGLDRARVARQLDPGSFEGWKWAGMIEVLRGESGGLQPVPRFRMGFDPLFDLGAVRATYLLRQAIERAPHDGNVLLGLAGLDLERGLHESGVTWLERYLARTGVQDDEATTQLGARQQLELVRERVGVPPKSLAWENLRELNVLVETLYAQGRAATAADLLESAYPADRRPWEIADRIATIRLHLGEPERASRAWAAGIDPPSEALRLGRVAVARFAMDDLDGARASYEAAIAAGPESFEVRYGLAVLEADAGRADAAMDSAREAERLAPSSSARSATARLIAAIVPYVPRPTEANPSGNAGP